MRFFNRALAFVPLSIHIAYAAATLAHLPPDLGRTAATQGTKTAVCLILWFFVVGLCNAAFIFLHMRMPKFRNSFLTLTKRADSPEMSEERRAETVRRFQSIAETALLSMNVFFLAVYQAVYQANVLLPVMQFPMPVLFVGFMVAPLLLTAVHIAFVSWSLKEKSK
jgi:Ca2+/H+ antiporter